jgi:hypothetical protein
VVVSNVSLDSKGRILRIPLTSKDKKDEGAQFVKYLGPLLNALRGLGGSAKAEEAVDRVAEDLKVPDTVLNDTLPSTHLNTESGVSPKMTLANMKFGSCEYDAEALTARSWRRRC